MISKNGVKAPINPMTFYGGNIWVNWSVFLERPIFKKKLNNIYYSYDECKMVIQEKRLKSKSHFFREIKNIIKEDIRVPYNPYLIFKDEWIGWGNFLGTNRIQDNLKTYLPFEQAREWARELELKMRVEWRRLDLDKLPDDIPKKPEKTYKDKGWIDYYDWLGINKRDRISYGEKKVFDFLKLSNINFIYNKSVLDCRHNSKLRFDFYLPYDNLCIEYDGIQHYKPIDFFGGDDEFQKTKMRDEIKNIFCKVNGIKLIRIPYYLGVDEIEEIIKKEVN